ncbi:SH3 domain-containing protein [Tunturibacter empetritectus]|uniref:SH3-like domain-containing protein n=1 Tax=Tunturiibacter empetritectus TaxID=3069691 RepID=A0A7W8MRW0_9BACT|nr:SH3 domain-containing protein [Edaphobacter lichenicola]MBB5317742.1 SH3-like domain-containing protein [Edaphobacter lichenicola]
MAVSVLLVGGSGCSRLRPKPAAQYVYVTAKQTFLRDRVAAVSNRTATVENGDRLEVLDHGRRFVKVQTAKGEQGWIDEKVVATQDVFDQFEKLKQDHKADPVVASAVVRDEVYMHAKPGRDTERFFRLAEGEKLKLLARATLAKPLPPGTRVAKAAPVPVPATATTTGSAGKGVKAVAPAVPDEPAAPVMEDWWLVRDSKGDTGWLFSRMMDVDAPDAITRYSEGQRIVGSYVLTTVNDPEAEQDDKNIPIYVTVLSPYKAGLTYDFDQVRVFTWNVKKHRYETGYRDRNIEGYLPVTVTTATDPYGKLPAATTPAPTFSYRVLSDDAGPVVPDPVTGAIVPGKTVVKTYRLESNLVRRVIQPGTTAPGEAHPEPVSEKKKGAAGKGGKGKKKR